MTENPVRLTRSIKDALTRVTAGGAPVHVWPGGGITFMVDVTRMPADAFGYVPTPALVAPIEFTLSRAEFAALGGHVDRVVPLKQALEDAEHRAEPWPRTNPWPLPEREALMPGEARMAMLPEGRRLHLQHGPIDIVAEAFGEERRCAPPIARPARASPPFSTVWLPSWTCCAAPSARPVLRSRGPVARRMLGACWPHRAQFVTPMAAVAGSVADEVLAAMTAGRRLTRAYVNNGGDIAVHLGPGTSFSPGVVNDPDRPGLDERIVLGADGPARGMATSGWRGRSLSFGIADAVTVLAESAAACRRRGDADRQCRHRRPSRHRAGTGGYAPRGERSRRALGHGRGRDRCPPCRGPRRSTPGSRKRGRCSGRASSSRRASRSRARPARWQQPEPGAVAA